MVKDDLCIAGIFSTFVDEPFKIKINAMEGLFWIKTRYCAVIYPLVLFVFRQLHIYIDIMNSNALRIIIVWCYFT